MSYSTTPIGRMLKSILCTSLVLFISMPAMAQEQQQESEMPNDQGITMFVKEQFEKDNSVKENLIEVETKNGVVTLSGEVRSLLEKRRAAEIVENVKGVSSVVNDLVVKSSGMSDGAIKQEIVNTLKRDPATTDFDVNVQVKDGFVVLTGMVESYAQKQLTEQVVMGVHGVREIDNQLTLQYRTERTDKEIKQEVKQRLNWNAMTNGLDIKVDINDGKVTLSGTVRSIAEKKRAQELAWVNGVRSVKAENIDVNWDTETLWRDKSWRDLHGETIRSDEKVRNAIERAMMYDPRVNRNNVRIMVDDGTVTLSGMVDDQMAKQAASVDAHGTIGVWRVKNFVQIKPEKEETPEDLTQEMREWIENDPYLSNQEVSGVVRDDFTAVLNGNVDTPFEREQAEQLAWHVPGVVDVNNYITVGQEWIQMEDWEIENDIQSELYWSPYVDRADVDVEVTDGVAYLTGTVDSWNERESARENAYEGGAKRVVNDLLVNYGPGELRPEQS